MNKVYEVREQIDNLFIITDGFTKEEAIESAENYYYTLFPDGVEIDLFLVECDEETGEEVSEKLTITID